MQFYMDYCLNRLNCLQLIDETVLKGLGFKPRYLAAWNPEAYRAFFLFLGGMDTKGCWA